LATKREKQRRFSFILTLALVALIGYFLISLVSVQLDIKEKKQELAEAQTQLEEVSEQNEDLKDLKENEDNESYMERVARDILGYVLPGESVYYDTASGSGE
jgi:cell division protein FtsB